MLDASQTNTNKNEYAVIESSYKSISESSKIGKFHEFPSKIAGTTRDLALTLNSPLSLTKLSFRLNFKSKFYAQAETEPEVEVEGLDEEGDEFGDELEEDFGNEFTDKETEEVLDPLSSYNRLMHDFNDTFFTYVLFPISRGYRWLVPEGGRLAIKRFFNNILYPIRFVNNLLQFKLLNAGEETLRFSINSTIGLLGFFDPAKSWLGLEEHNEDFGQTLGYYGVGGGFHIVLPFLGPSNLRDSVSMYPDNQLDPFNRGSLTNNVLNQSLPKALAYQPDLYQWLGITLFENINDVSFKIETIEGLKKDALDYYLVLRDFYEQNRNKQIKE